ncbi:hypothetical protein TruAng_007789 [Truncatella angustata]|nr:hypothetical protein TruAng_007789 [Truncatella angustata]
MNNDMSTASSDGAERCEICWDKHPSSEFVDLPCTFGHRFGSACVTRWLSQLNNSRRPGCQCPKCREDLVYDECEHFLEARRVASDERNLIVYELGLVVCLKCRDRARGLRRMKLRRAYKKGQPCWDYLQPGDLLPDELLEEFTPEEYKEKFKEARAEHARAIQDLRDKTAEMAPGLDMEKDERGWMKYWDMRSRIMEYDRIETPHPGDIGATHTFFGIVEGESDDDGDDYEDDNIIDDDINIDGDENDDVIDEGDGEDEFVDIRTDDDDTEVPDEPNESDEPDEPGQE